MTIKRILSRFAGLLALACLFTLTAQAAPNITVSASAVSILGTTQTISITCTLIDPNQTGNLRVSGSGVIPIFVASTVTPGSTATVGPIYGNDVILDGFGNLNNTYYKVQVFTVSGGVIASTPALQNYYAFTGSGTVDLATATPLAPSFMSGASGSVVVPGNLTAIAGQNSGVFFLLNNVVLIDGNKYPCTDVGLNAAIAAAPAGGYVDARFCNGATLAATVSVAGSGKTLLLGPGTWANSGSVNPLFIVDRAANLQLQSATVISQTTIGNNAVILAGTGAAFIHGGIRGPGLIQGAGASSTAACIVYGGSTDPGNSASNGAQDTVIQDLKVTGCKYGLLFGNNVFTAHVDRNKFFDNNTSNMFEPNGLTGTGEALMFSENAFSMSTGGSGVGSYNACVDFEDNSGVFFSTSVAINNSDFAECQLKTAGSVWVHANGGYFENINNTAAGNSNPAILCGGLCVITADMFEDNAAETKTASIQMTGIGRGTITGSSFCYRNGTFFCQSSVFISAAVQNNGSGNVLIDGITNIGYTNNCVKSSTGHCQVVTDGALVLDSTTVIDPSANLTGNSMKYVEATAPSGAASADICYGDSTLHGRECNVNNTTFLPLGSRAVLTADWTCGTGGTVASCVAATIVGSGGGVAWTFSLPLVANSAQLDCDGVVGQATAATANQWNLLTATNGATNVTALYDMYTAATAKAGGAVTDQASTTTTFQIAPSWTLGGTATKMPFHIHAAIEGASASGTVVSVQLIAPTVGDLVTIYRGSGCWIHP